MMMQRLIVHVGQARRTVEQHTGRIRCRPGLTERGPPGHAWQAVPALRHEREHHVITDTDVGYLATHFDHFAGRFMAEYHGQWSWSIALHHAEIRVTKPRGGDANAHIMGTRRGEQH